MNRKRTGKKAAKKKNVPAKRKYTKRSTKVDVGGGLHVDDIELFRIEKVDKKDLRARPSRLDEQREKIEELLKKLKVGEGFVIKASWVRIMYKTVEKLQLPIGVRSAAVSGNDKVRRVIRYS